MERIKIVLGFIWFLRSVRCKTKEYVKYGTTNASSPNLMREHITKPSGTQTERYIYSDVGEGSNAFAILPQIHRLIAKR
jgi:hypothetical protein